MDKGLRTELNANQNLGPNLNFLLLNLTGDYRSWYSESSNADDPFMEANDEHEWRSFGTPAGNSLSITLCVASFWAIFSNSTIRGPAPQFEPILEAWVNDTWGYDTSHVRTMYGAVPDRANHSTQDRGIFTVDKQATWGKDYMQGLHLQTLYHSSKKIISQTRM